MRSFRISFTKIKAKEREDHDNIFTQEAERLQKLIHVQQQLITEIRNQLERILLDRARGACICSKAWWHEFGERSSKYSLIKSSQKKLKQSYHTSNERR